MKKSKIWIVIGSVGILLLLLTFASPFLIMYYAEEQYFVDQYKKNKNAFKDVKDELLLTLERENATKLNLVICYDDENGRLLQHYDRTTYPVDYSHPIDANRESYNIVNNSFGDYGLSKYMLPQIISAFQKKETITSLFILLNAHLNQHIMPQEMMTKFTGLVIIGI